VEIHRDKQYSENVFVSDVLYTSIDIAFSLYQMLVARRSYR
jgi:hypothetical protein